MNTQNLEKHLEKYSKEQLIALISQLFSEYRILKKGTDPIADVVAYFAKGVNDNE